MIATVVPLVVAPVYAGVLPAVPFGPPVMLMVEFVGAVTVRTFVWVKFTVAVTVAPEAGAATALFEPEPVFFATATVYGNDELEAGTVTESAPVALVVPV